MRTSFLYYSEGDFMKKIIALILALSISTTLISCGKSDTQNSENTNSVTSNEQEDTSSEFDWEVFASEIQGIWVDMNNASLDMYEFMSIHDKEIFFSVVPGDGGRAGTITNIEKLSETNYRMTIFYPESKIYEETLAEETYIRNVEITDTTIKFEDENTVWTYVCDEFESLESQLKIMLSNTGEVEGNLHNVLNLNYAFLNREVENIDHGHVSFLSERYMPGENVRLNQFGYFKTSCKKYSGSNGVAIAVNDGTIVAASLYVEYDVYNPVRVEDFESAFKNIKMSDVTPEVIDYTDNTKWYVIRDGNNAIAFLALGLPGYKWTQFPVTTYIEYNSDFYNISSN